MKFLKAILVLFVILTIAGLTACHKSEPAEADQEAPVPVEVAKIEKKRLAEPEIAYGSVIAQPARVQVQSVAFDSQVQRVLVAPGQVVKAGELLVEMVPSAAARLELQQALSTANAAHRDLEQTQARFAMKLATNQDLGTSQKAASDADLQLQNLQANHQGGENGIVATMDGIVAKVDVQNGQIVAAGGAMVETVAEDDIQAKIGVDPDNLDILKPGVPVQIQPVSGNTVVSGTVRLTTLCTDTDTRLVDVYVSLPPKSGLLLNDYVKGTFDRVADDALAVPVSAVESDENGYCIYTVENGKAVRHSVDQGVEADGKIEVTGSGLGAGMSIITTGSHEVSDGAAVKLPGSGRRQMNFAAWAQRHARSLLFLIAALAIAGAASSVSLPVALFPQVSFPRVRIDLDAGDRPAEQMLAEVTSPIEQSVRAVPGVRGVRSTTSRGSAEISVDFEWGDDMGAAMLQVESQVNKQLPSLPAGTDFSVKRMDPTVFPVIAYSLTSDNHSLAELRDLAVYALMPALAATRGVAGTDVLGGETEEYHVVADPGRLQALGLTIKEVADALSAANVLTAVGKVEEYDKLYLVISDTRFHDFNEIGRTVIKSGPGGVVLLSDVAKIEKSTVPQWTRVTADGHDAVLFQIYQQPGGNTVQIAADIKSKLAKMGGQIPTGVKLANWYDQSELIVGSAGSARDAVLIGICLAAVILILFLRSWRVTLIAILTVPAVLCSTILMLTVLKMSFNIMTLGGMAAAVGLIIDDAIVMVEHVIRRVRSGGNRAMHETVMQAAAEFTRPLAGSSAATIVIFAPLAFLSGVAGAFFKTMSLTMAASLAISFLVSWLAVPILSARWLEKEHEFESHGRLTRAIHRGYSWIMDILLGQPLLALVPVAAVALAGWIAFQNVGSGFMPAMDEGGFIIDYVSPPGTSLRETDRLLRKVEAILQETPEVATYSRRTGSQLGGGVTEANTGDFFVRLKAPPRRSIEAVMDEVREKAGDEVPGLDIETAQLMEDLIGDLTSVPQPIEVKLYSEDEQQLEDLAPKVADAIGKVNGVVEVVNGVIPAGDALTIRVDRVKAALEGIDPDGVTKAVQDMLDGNVTTQIQNGPKLVGVRVWIPNDTRDTIRKLESLQLRAPGDGHLFPLKRVAQIIPVTGQPEITRDNLRRMVAVTGRITGRDLGSAARDVEKALNAPGLLPSNVQYTMGGLYEQQQIAFRGLTMVMIAAVALVFLLLLFLYESFRAAGAMMLVALLAVAGVYVGLWVTGTEFNITSRMGMTMVVGIVTEISIFYFSEYQELAGTDRRFITAGLNRMRPIMMTSFAAMLALMPLALGLGNGADMLRPLAIAIISGLVCALPLVLILLPALLALMSFGRTGGKKDT